MCAWGCARVDYNVGKTSEQIVMASRPRLKGAHAFAIEGYDHDGFKRNWYISGFFWRTGLKNIFGDLVKRSFVEAFSSTGSGFSDMTDLLVEKSLAHVAKLIFLGGW